MNNTDKLQGAYSPALTAIIPSIDPRTWIRLYTEVKNSCHPYNCEVIAVGPKLPPIELEGQTDFRYIRDFGCPARCFQLATTIAEGRFVTWLPDDCIVEPRAYAECISLMDTKRSQDGMTILYSEGINFSGNQHDDPSYWMAWTHAGLRFPKVEKHWKIAPIFLYNLNYYREIGGLDCRYEHINMNAHDLAFRVQRAGGEIYSSPRRVLKLNWRPWSDQNKGAIQNSYEQNDEPLFRDMFSTEGIENPVSIDYNNWKNADVYWRRRVYV